MKILKTYMITALSALALSSHAYIFFDDFDGDDLKPYWYIDKGEFYSGNWEYTVENSMLNIWNVWGEGSIGIVDICTLDGTFPNQYGDFDIRTRVGWEEGEYQTLYFAAARGGGNIPASMGYRKVYGQDPYLYIHFSNWGGSNAFYYDVPKSGMHEFRIRRTGNVLEAYFNNVMIHSSGITQTASYLGSVNYRMIGPPGYNNPDFAPLYVDWVAVVPEPASLTCLSTFLAYLFTRRKK